MNEHINTGRDPNEKELRDAERVLSLSPTQQSGLLFWTASPWLVTVSNSGKHFGKGPRPGRNAIGRGGEKRFTFAFAGARSPRNTKPIQLASPSELDVEAIEIQRIVKHVCDLLRPEAEARKIEILITVEEPLPQIM